MKLYREWALLIGVRLTSWQWRYVESEWVRSRWLVLHLGPWRVETEFIRHVEDDDI